MKTILRVDASPSGPQSISRQLTGAVVARLRAAEADVRVVERDLTAFPISHLDGELIQALRPAPGAAPADGPAVQRELALTESLLAEFLAADVVVIGAPMFNFSIPSQLKAWIDRLAQPGRTFRYTEKGPVGLAAGKRVVVVSSRGGMYAGTAIEAAMDHQEAYLRAVLGFFGITDLTFVRAEGTSMGDERRATALRDAQRDIEALMPNAAAA